MFIPSIPFVLPRVHECVECVFVFHISFSKRAVAILLYIYQPLLFTTLLQSVENWHRQKRKYSMHCIITITHTCKMSVCKYQAVFRHLHWQTFLKHTRQQTESYTYHLQQAAATLKNKIERDWLKNIILYNYTIHMQFLLPFNPFKRSTTVHYRVLLTTILCEWCTYRKICGLFSFFGLPNKWPQRHTQAHTC